MELTRTEDDLHTPRWDAPRPGFPEYLPGSSPYLAFWLDLLAETEGREPSRDREGDRAEDEAQSLDSLIRGSFGE